MSESEKHRPTRIIEPQGMRVLVRILPGDERTKAGLYLPKGVEQDSEDAMYGEVIAVARTAPTDTEELEGENVSGIPDGSKVLFAPSSGYRVPWDAELRLVDTKDVLAVVEEIDPAKTH